jgi:L-ascorbate metabolism protein UlaG (beta-lactamase superfamily)
MQITFYGHNSFLFESDVSILTDPFIASNPKAKQIVMEDIKADHVLITHGHADHLADLDKILAHNDAKIITMVEVASWLAKQGHSHSHSLNFGGTYEFSKETSAKYVQAVHSSSMPDGSYGGHPGSFILKTGGKTIFIAGHNGLVGSAIVRKLREKGYNNLIIQTRKELDLTNQTKVFYFREISVFWGICFFMIVLKFVWTPFLRFW